MCGPVWLKRDWEGIVDSSGVIRASNAGVIGDMDGYGWRVWIRGMDRPISYRHPGSPFEFLRAAKTPRKYCITYLRVEEPT